MTTTLFESLPAPLKSVQMRPLFVMRLDVRPIVVVGATPGPFRRVGIVPSGSFEGDRLSGKVLDGGSDWQAVRCDGSTTLDVRLVLRGSPWTGGSDTATRKRRGRRSIKLLLPDQPHLRSAVRSIRVAESYHRDRYRPSFREWTYL
jgi:hypothetical protein